MTETLKRAGEKCSKHPWSLWVRMTCAVAAIGLLTTACQITAPKARTFSGEKPSEDVKASAQEIRIRMRALVEPLSGAIVEAADQIMIDTRDPAIRREALVWKIQSVSVLRESLFRPNPFVAIADSWAFTFQMRDYFNSGPGKELLQDAAPIAVSVFEHIETELQSTVASFTTSGDVTEPRELLQNWASENPISHSITSRASVLSEASERTIRSSISSQELAGTLLITLDDISRRVDVYSVQLMEQARWQAELFAMDQAARYELEKALPLAEAAVISAEDAVATLKDLAPAIKGALETAGETPEIIATERTEIIDKVEDEMDDALAFLREERTAALDHITTEREAALLALQSVMIAERETLVKEMERISEDLVDHTMWRVAQITAGSLVAIFFGIILLMVVARRLFVINKSNE